MILGVENRSAINLHFMYRSHWQS